MRRDIRELLEVLVGPGQLFGDFDNAFFGPFPLFHLPLQRFIHG